MNAFDSSTEDVGDSAAERITDIQLDKVAKLIGPGWRALATKLGRTFAEQEALATPAKGGPGEYAGRMLSTWYQNTGNPTSQVVQDKLCRALKEAKRRDVAQQVENYFKAASPPGIEEIFQNISQSLTREWTDVAVYLGVSFSVCEDIKTPQQLTEDPGMAILMRWQRSTTKPQKKTIINALEEIGRKDIVLTIDPEYYSPAPAPAESTTRGEQERGRPMDHSPTSNDAAAAGNGPSFPTPSAERTVPILETPHPISSPHAAFERQQDPANSIHCASPGNVDGNIPVIQGQVQALSTRPVPTQLQSGYFESMKSPPPSIDAVDSGGLMDNAPTHDSPSDCKHLSRDINIHEDGKSTHHPGCPPVI